MSEQTWLDEYYPVPASDFEGSADLIAATKHSLQKWEGNIIANSDKHGIFEPPIGCGGNTCALCIACFGSDNSEGECVKCPIVLSGQLCCDARRSAYRKGTSEMIEALKVTLTYLEKQS